MNVKSYKDLIVWQNAMDLAEIVYQITMSFPKEEMYGLTNQLRRAAVSIPSNIEEGQARQSTAEFRNFLSMARGSLAEVETQLLLANRFKYITDVSLNQIMEVHQEVSKMIPALMRRLSD